jgi:hypothetical protein
VNRSFSTLILAVGTMALATTGEANAATQIYGEFDFVGSGDFGSYTPATAQFIDFGAAFSKIGNDPGNTTGTAGTTLVQTASASLLPYMTPGTTMGTISDISSLAGGVATPVSAANFITAGGFTFSTSNISYTLGTHHLSLFGSGTLSGNSFLPTPGQFRLVTNNVFPDRFDFAFTSMVSTVPETSTWAMLIIGFGMLGGVLRRRPATKGKVVSYA